MPALALTDHGALYGAIDFYHEAKAAGIKPIVGVETYIARKSRFDRDANFNFSRIHQSRAESDAAPTLGSA